METTEAETLHRKALECARDGDSLGAVCMWRECVDLDPGHADALANLGWYEQSNDRPATAIPYYRRALAARPGWEDVFVNLVDCHRLVRNLPAVEETAAGVSVRVADSERRVAFSPVRDPNSLNEAVVAAVAGLHENLPLLHLEAVVVRDVAGESALTVLLRLGDGRTLVGSEVVRGGLPFTLGQAVWRALTFMT
jgi:hypothetical protein